MCRTHKALALVFGCRGVEVGFAVNMEADAALERVQALFSSACRMLGFYTSGDWVRYSLCNVSTAC